MWRRIIIQGWHMKKVLENNDNKDCRNDKVLAVFFLPYRIRMSKSLAVQL